MAGNSNFSQLFGVIVAHNRIIFVIFLTVCDDTDRFSAFLSHISDMTIAVRPLPSGRSSNVTGNLCYLLNDPEKKQIQRFQFRVEEKDVKVFAIGTSNAVL